MRRADFRPQARRQRPGSVRSRERMRRQTAQTGSRAHGAIMTGYAVVVGLQVRVAIMAGTFTRAHDANPSDSAT